MRALQSHATTVDKRLSFHLISSPLLPIQSSARHCGLVICIKLTLYRRWRGVGDDKDDLWVERLSVSNLIMIVASFNSYNIVLRHVILGWFLFLFFPLEPRWELFLTMLKSIHSRFSNSWNSIPTFNITSVEAVLVFLSNEIMIEKPLYHIVLYYTALHLFRE